jgi:HPt (histidine-containing phosphotransfer) domain-containing protein
MGGGAAESVIDRAAFDDLVRTVGDDFIDELLAVFLGDAPRQIEAMRTGLEAGDAEVFQRAAHSLKSNAASFGARALSAQARELETMGRARTLEGAGPRLQAFVDEYARVEQALRALRRG